MANDPLPHQMTVGRLRDILSQAHDGTVVTLALPAGYRGHDQIPILVDVEISYGGGPVATLRPIRPDPQEAVGASGDL